MFALAVDDFDGRRAVTSPDQLREVLRHRSAGANHFEISAVDADYPMLDLLVREDHALLHYFHGEGGPVDQSIGNVAEPLGVVEFVEDSAGGKLPMPGSTVVDVATAVRCVEQFSLDLRRPAAIDWLGL